MAKKLKQLKQFRWYAEDDEKNSPVAKQMDYFTGNVFAKVYPITQLGIQALPGTEFYLNGSVKPIIIGVSGIYDLDVKNGARITGLSFSKRSLDRIDENTTNCLIVDVLYGEEE